MTRSATRRYHVGIASVRLWLVAAASAVPAFAHAQECARIADQIQFCGTAADWFPFDDADASSAASYLGPDGIVGQVYVDDRGTADGMTIDIYLLSILQDQQSLDLDAPLEVLGHAVEIVDGQEGRSLILGLQSEGRSGVMMLTVQVGTDHTARFVTLSERAATFTPQALAHRAFLDQMRVGDGNG